jgi:hypothetical protein
MISLRDVGIRTLERLLEVVSDIKDEAGNDR